MKLYEHIKDFSIKYCDCDFKDEIKASVALALMEEVACSSADELGFGYQFVKPRGYAFMVTNICMEFLQPVPLGSTVRLKTWPLPPTRVTFGREYQFLLPTGETAINASSRWCMIDMKEGKILQSKVLENQDYSTYNTTRVFEDVKWKIPTFLPDEGELRYTMTVASSDYDHNMHVNNTRYADFCLNCFSIPELATSRLKKFSITYVKQCKEGDELRFYRKKTEDGGYLVQGFNGNGETVVQSLMYFEDCVS
ncbi:MAG: hypothetical protein IJ284_04315 [Clostridia bacterium]|nr:hypothetical protein [Clostridia bacterium]